MVDTAQVTQLASEGYHTLQVPQFSIDLTGGPSADHTDYATDYFIPVKTVGYDKQRIAAGREKCWAFMYLSRKGWTRYYKDIKAAFTPNRGTWNEFVASALAELDEIETETRKELVKLQAKNAVKSTKDSLAKEQEMIDFLKRM